MPAFKQLDVLPKTAIRHLSRLFSERKKFARRHVAHRCRCQFDKLLGPPRPAEHFLPRFQWNFRKPIRFFHEHAKTSYDKNNR